MRLFIALDLPEAVRDSLAAWRPDLPDPRWTSADRLHLTLRFLGERPDARAETIADRMDTFAAAPVPVRTGDLIRLPSARRPRVLAVRLEENAALTDLYARLGATLAKVGVPPDERPPFPHVTLARFKTPEPAALRKALRGTSPPEAAGVATTVSLIHSERSAEGSTYTPIMTVTLG